MAFLNWDTSMSLGINSIDEQHKLLVEIINDFYENIGLFSNDEQVLRLFLKMNEYALTHFLFEEAYFLKFKYPHYEQHKIEHRFFYSKLKVLEAEIKSKEPIMAFEIAVFLKEWLKNHILVSDMEYKQFMIEHGVK